jgi:hypothetical protein
MSLCSEGPKDGGVQVGLATAVRVAVLVATVTFFRFSRYFPG